jgi:hypothetical protein
LAQTVTSRERRGAKTIFTTADNYVLEIKAPLADPLLSLVVTTALCVDTALKQDSRGLS